MTPPRPRARAMPRLPAAPRLLVATLLVGLVGGGRAGRVAIAPHDADASASAAPRGGAAAQHRPRGRGLRRWQFVAALVAAAGVDGAVEQSEDARKNFQRLDINRDGKVDAVEYEAVVRDTMDRVASTSEEVKQAALEFFDELYDYADIDDDAFLSPREAEFANFVQKFAAQRHLERAKTLREEAEAKVDKALAGVAGEEGLKAKQVNADASVQAAKIWDTAGADEEDRVLTTDEAIYDSYDSYGRDLAADLMKEHDTNRDGLIDKEEFDNGTRKATTNWGLEFFANDPDIQYWYDDMFRYADITGDGFLNPREAQYVNYLSQEKLRQGPWPDKELAGTLMKELDDNGDMFIDLQEVRRGVEVVEADMAGDDKAEMIIHRIRDKFADFDDNRDGKLSLREATMLAKYIISVFKRE